MILTTKENILSIAPELRSFLLNERQTATIRIVAAVEHHEYTVVIDDIECSYTATETDTIEDIVEKLEEQIELEVVDVTTVTTADTIKVIVLEAGHAMDISANSSVYIEINYTRFAHNGQEIFDLILEDVANEVTEERYRLECERAQRYLAAHLLTIMKKELEGETIDDKDRIKERVNEVEIWYSDKKDSISTDDALLSLTTYGMVFMGIRRRHAVVFV